MTGTFSGARRSPSGRAIRPERLHERLEALGRIGRLQTGGISRWPFSAEHRAAARLVAGWMREAGMAAGVDAAGNLIGVLPGREPLPPIAAGSHIDTVPDGGMFDGALGCLAALECAQAVADSGERPRHPLVVIAFADEEGNAFGQGCLASRCLVGEVPPERWGELQGRDGRSLARSVAEFGRAGLPAWDPAWLSRPQGDVVGGAGLPASLRERFPAGLRAFLELHVEQGPELDRQGLPLAVVEGIAGMSRATFTFEGQANHAGTTPMDLRQDALWGASEFVLGVRRLAEGTGKRAVGTVGVLQVYPGATNVVPGRVALRVELRSADEALLAELRARAEALGAECAARNRLRFTAEAWDHAEAQPLDPEVRAVIVAAARDLGVEPVDLPSWAGHDSKVMAPFVPTGMLFVPSRGGYSHSPREFTPPESIETGAAVLLRAIERLDET